MQCLSWIMMTIRSSVSHIGTLYTICAIICVKIAEETVASVRTTPNDIPQGTLCHGSCRLAINEFSTYPINGLQYVEFRTICDKKARDRVSHFSMDGKDGSYYKLIFIDAAGFLLGVCDLKGKTKTQHQDEIFYTVGGSAVPNRDFATESCQFAQDHHENSPGRFPAASSSPVAMALIHNSKPSVIDGVALDHIGLFRMKTKISYSMEKVILRNLMDMYVYSSSSPQSYCDYFGRFYGPYGESDRTLLRDWVQKDFETDKSQSRCDTCVPGTNSVQCQPFQPDLFAITEKTPNAPNNCDKPLDFRIEDTQPRKKKPRIQPISGGEYSCYINTEDMAIDAAGMISYPLTYMQKVAAAEKEMTSSLTANFNRAREIGAAASLETTAMTKAGNIEAGDAASEGNFEDGGLIIGEDTTTSTVPVADAASMTEAQVTEASVERGEEGLSRTDPANHIITESQFKSIVLNSGSSEIASDANHVDHGYAKPDVPWTSAPTDDFEIRPVAADNFENEISKDAPYVWESCTGFQPVSLISKLKSEKNPRIDPDDILKPDVCYWFEYLPHTESYRCRLCNRLLKQKLIFDRKGSPLITPVMKDGQKIERASAKYRNRKTIADHLQNPLHLAAVDYFKLFDSGKRGTELKAKFERQGGPLRSYLNATENFAVIVRQSTILGLPFNKFPEILELMKFFNVNVGHVHQNPKGYKTMLMTLSQKNHLDLVQHLKTARPVMSVMIDGSSDVSSLSSLVVMFMTYDENNNVGVVVYRVLPVTERETGENMFNLFMKALKEDGLDSYVKEKCVGFASDGASNMGVFRKLLQDFTDNDIVLVHCMAHRIELVVKHAWADLEYLKYVQATTNLLYRTFESNAPKKKQILLKKIEELGDSKFTLKIIKKIRWISSKLRALDVVFQHFPTIIAALKAVQEDRSIPLAQRQNAELLEKHLRDGTFLATLAFLADTAEEVSFVSRDLQIRGTTLITKKEKRTRMKRCVEKLLKSPGKRLSKLLSSAIVASSRKSSTVSLKDFETASISYQGVNLLPPQEAFADRLYLRREEYINNILVWTDKYFPEGVTDNYDILDASTWTTLGLQTFGDEKLLEMNSKLNWNLDKAALKNGWSRLKLSVIRAAEFPLYKNASPETFWTFFLGLPSIDWTPEIRTVITNALTIPASTAEVERLFSMYTQTKTVQRYSLDVSTMEAILRVKFNGGEPLKELDTLGVVQLFLESHARTDDSGRRGTKGVEDEKVPTESLEAVTDPHTSRPNFDSKENDDDDDTIIDSFAVDGYDYGDVDY